MVLYNMMNTFTAMSKANQVVGAVEIILALTSFFTIAIGGLLVGIIMGLVTALITRTTSEVRG